MIAMLNYQYEIMEESLAREIQKVLGSGSQEFIEDTIVGSDINQIRHIFYHLKAEHRGIGVEYMGEPYQAHITDIQNTAILLKINGFQEGPFRRCHLKFEAFRVLYQFEVLILAVGRNEITIKMPYFIQSAKRRQHKRVITADLYLKWTTLYRPFLDSRSDLQIAESRFGRIMDELKKDMPDLNLINRIVIDEMERISPEYRISFTNTLEDDDFLLNVLTEEGKTVFIEDMSRLETLFESKGAFKLINFNNHFRKLAAGSSREEATRFFEQLQANYLKKFVSRLVCAPIFIFDTLIGNLYVQTTLLDYRHISMEQAKIVDLMANLLTYALNKTVIGRSHFSHPMTKIKNISISGLLFELNNEPLFRHLIFNDRLKLNLQIRHEDLELESEVARYFKTDKGYNVGVNFIGAMGDDFRTMETYVYETSKVGAY